MSLRTIITSLLLLYVIQSSVSYGRSRPLEEVSHPACKSLHRDDHPDFCKLSLPTISYQDFQTSYKSSTLLQLIFSLPRKSPYKEPTAMSKGSHPSLDIATSKGTPVYAMGKGTVVSAGFIRGYGNSITIKHQIAQQTIYSSYSHLDTILVSVGEKIDEQQHIGKVGNSGMFMGKYGNHLDFQITTAESPAHPYGFAEFSGQKYTDIVNKGLYQDALAQYTLDPLEFLTQTEAVEEPVRTTISIQWTKAYTKINNFFTGLAKGNGQKST